MSGPVVLMDEAAFRRIVAEEVGREAGLLRQAVVSEIRAAARPPDSPHLLTRQKVGQLLCIDLRTLRRMELAGEIPPATRIGTKTVRWRRDDIEEFVRTGRVDSPKSPLSIRPRRGSV